MPDEEIVVIRWPMRRYFNFQIVDLHNVDFQNVDLQNVDSQNVNFQIVPDTRNACMTEVLFDRTKFNIYMKFGTW
jgi:uncharacterized protein YjbI with pentapeptide repeats